MSARGEARRARRFAGWGLALAAVALAGLAWLRADAAARQQASAPLAAERADLAARRGAAAFADAQAAFAAMSRRDLGRDHRPADLVTFVRAGATQCAGAAAATGPYYCPAARRAGLDLGALDGLAVRLRREGERGAALVAARLAAAHVAAELGWGAGEAAAGDCLAGVWATRAGARLGPMSGYLYGRTLDALADAAAAGRPAGPVWRDPDLFAAVPRADRERAFERGLGSGFGEGALAVCAP